MDRRSLLQVHRGHRCCDRRRAFGPPTVGRGGGARGKSGLAPRLTKFGDLKYPTGFHQFDYVNASAPKGGKASAIVLGTFDNFNSVVVGVKGTLAFGIDLIYNTLLVSSLDEVSSSYGLLAEAVSYPGRLFFRDVSPAGRKPNGTTASRSHRTTSCSPSIHSRSYSPRSAASYRQVVKAEKTGDRDVTFTFEGAGNANCR